MSEIILSFIVGFCAICVYFGLFRNQSVYLTRISFIGDAGYDHLPDYDTMLYSPRHQLRWTKAQWSKWLEKQEAA